MPDGTSAVISTMRVTYRQDWPKYNAAQCEEKDRVMILLRELCDNIHNEPQLGRGRRKAALSDVIFAAAMKTFVGMSGRRATSDVRACAEKGFLDKPIAYNTIFDYLERPELTPILKGLVRRAALPLATVETKFAIDGTGFGSKVYKRWYDAKYGREMKEATWVKLHAICGVQTNIITAVEVTDATLNDSPLLPQLVRETAVNFEMEEIMADKAYLGHKNLEGHRGCRGRALRCIQDQQPRRQTESLASSVPSVPISPRGVAGPLPHALSHRVHVFECEARLRWVCPGQNARGHDERSPTEVPRPQPFATRSCNP